jgi:hypothetical protein
MRISMLLTKHRLLDMANSTVNMLSRKEQRQETARHQVVLHRRIPTLHRLPVILTRCRDPTRRRQAPMRRRLVLIRCCLVLTRRHLVPICRRLVLTRRRLVPIRHRRVSILNQVLFQRQVFPLLV